MIAELFLDGRPLFNLSQLLEYCGGDRETFEAALKKIGDKLIRVSPARSSIATLQRVDVFAAHGEYHT